ncbi:hypothetical protein DH2020_000045 [Rehmannia glutinosa]|uniref:Scarecrow-like protein n=1 Tax=Rehmannia glutinosa TaxID=99300 RepID=A0ABR0XVM3_REHGL
MRTISLGRCDSRNGFQLYDPGFSDGPGILKGSSQNNPCDDSGDQVACDYFGGVFDYIKQMLLEEDDLDHRPCMFQDCSALQAAEKYFYDALSDKDDKDSSTPPFNGNIRPSSTFSVANPGSGISTNTLPTWPLLDNNRDGLFYGGPTFSCDFDTTLVGPFHVLNSNGVDKIGDSFVQINEFGNEKNPPEKDSTRVRKIHDRGDGDNNLERSSKQIASYTEEEDSVGIENYDKSMLCPKMNPGFYDESPSRYSDESSESEDENKKEYRKTKVVKRGRPKGSKKNSKASAVVDLRGLLTRCAEAVSSFNISTGEKLLQQIRQYCSFYGDANERLAHCFANALEARMAGTGSALYTAFASRRIPASELLKSYQAYVTSCPFKRMSNIFANKSIAKFTGEASRVHIIDFGILYGFQWPCIIHGISLRPGGPPVLKITGIDLPQPGFKPAERVEQTGRRLMDFCKRFNVPFEYNAIAKKWDDIRVEDLKIERDEMVVVNCLYRLRHVPDESAGVNLNSPRDKVLKLIKKINPDLFVHGVVNGTYNAPFFATRFREALFHYSSFFDMMEATLPREDQDRLLYEREVFGRDVMNVLACEGPERVERPETYKQWQVRNQRAGFRVMPLSREIMGEVKTKVRKGYHKDFLLDEDGGWMLQGWKGRVLYGLSCWRPSRE